MNKISKETKNANPEIYGYEFPWEIPGNEGCGRSNPVNKGKEKSKCPKFKVPFTSFLDRDGDRRYVACTKEVADYLRNAERNESRERNDENRCLIPSGKYGFKKCRENCLCCPYDKDKQDGAPMSLENLYEDYMFEPSDDSCEEMEETANDRLLIEKIKLLAADMDDFDKYIIEHFNDSNALIAKKLNTTKQVITYRRRRLIKYFQKNLKNF